MTRNEKIKQLVIWEISYRIIGDVYNITKQRVHQIAKNYVGSTFKTVEKHITMVNLLGGICEVCGIAGVLDIHHKVDRNDNSLGNLSLLCKKHHVEEEKFLRDIGIKKWNFQNREKTGHIAYCIICKKEIWVIPARNTKFCSKECRGVGSRKPVIHGTSNTYGKGCHCTLCRRANTIRCRKYN